MSDLELISSGSGYFLFAVASNDLTGYPFRLSLSQKPDRVILVAMSFSQLSVGVTLVALPL